MNLEAVFSCLGDQGIEGSGRDQPMDALSRALSPEFAGENGCNAGFLRDDANLFKRLARRTRDRKRDVVDIA